MAVNAEARALMTRINRKYGAEAIVLGSDMKIATRFTSGSIALDVALGGGWPANQWSEVIGKESHGKTSVVLKTIAANQARDKDFTALWIAAEHFNEELATACGCDTSRIIVVPTQQMEFAYSTILEFAESRTVDCIVLDSYPALIPDEEQAKEMDEMVVAIGARLTGKFFRKAGKATRRSLVDPDDRPLLGIIINQWRDQIGGFSPRGTPKTTPGGNAKNYAFYVRVEVSRDDWIDEARPGKGKVRVGQTIKVRTVKNKTAAPQQVATVHYYFRDAPYLGFSKGDYDTAQELLVLAQLFDVVTRRGATYRYGETVWKGKEALFASIREDLDLQEDLRTAILDASQRPDTRTLDEEEVPA